MNWLNTSRNEEEDESENEKKETEDEEFERMKNEMFKKMDAHLESVGWDREQQKFKEREKLDPSKAEHTIFVVRKVFASNKTTENIGQYKYNKDGVFSATYGFHSNRVIIEKSDSGSCYLFKFDNKYFKTAGHWVYSTESRDNASRYDLIRNDDIYDPHSFLDRPVLTDDLFYIKDIQSGELLNMDSDGDFNVKNSGRYVLVYKYKI